MAKIMLVEDDNNLREIYEARLLAEGYEIVSAKDGEEALAMAVKEKPDLIISDVMMPKISGFDMLDILRSTPETNNTKVIMMTALSQAEDKTRADKLGADRYLVKSQVTLEDVAKVARDVLNGEESTPPAVVTEAAAAAVPTQPPVPTPVVAAPAEPASPVVPQTPPTEPSVPVDDTTPPAPVTPPPAPTTDPPATPPADTGTDLPKVEAASAAVQPAESLQDPGITAAKLTEAVHKALGDAEPEQPQLEVSDAASVAAAKRKVIQPMSDLNAKPDLDALLKQEEARATAAQVVGQTMVDAPGSQPAAPAEPVIATAPPASTDPAVAAAASDPATPSAAPATELPPVEASAPVTPPTPAPVQEPAPTSEAPQLAPVEAETAQTVQDESSAVSQQIEAFEAKPVPQPATAPIDAAPATEAPASTPPAEPVAAAAPADAPVPAPAAPVTESPAAEVPVAQPPTDPNNPNDPNSIAL